VADRDEKIYPALPHKRQRAREQGEVARSRDLTAALTFAGAAIGAAAALPLIGEAALTVHQRAFGASGELGYALGAALEWPLLAVIAIGGGLSLIALGATAVQEGLAVVPTRLAPDFKRLNPAAYFGRIFSAGGLLELAKSALKIGLVTLLGWRLAKEALELSLRAGGVNQTLGVITETVRRLLGWSAAIALVAGAADYAYQRYQHEAEMRMTRQEFLDELKQEEGNPQIKRALRIAMRRKAKRVRGIHQAATATVVLTNPTHYAVALRYRRGFDQAPLVVAKGAGEQAHRVIAIARMAAVPIMPNPPLARALFRGVETGEFIPRHFYRAVAEVLTLIMRAEAKRRTEAAGGVS